MLKRADVSIIVAVDESGGFAKGRTIPWSHAADWQHFKNITDGNTCIMGRRTYEDIAERRRQRNPDFGVLLPNRNSYVLSNTLKEAQGATLKTNLTAVLTELPADGPDVYVLGGRRLYVEVIQYAKQVWMTVVPGTHDTNKKFPIEQLKNYTIVDGYKKDNLMFVKYVRNVIYYTLNPRNPKVVQRIADHYRSLGKLIGTTATTVVFVDPKPQELKDFRTIGKLSERKGLATDYETRRDQERIGR